MQKGIITSNISNLYKVEINNKIYECNARGKFKNNEISPVAGDLVEIEIINEEKKLGIINKIEERKNYLKRPKMANLSQIMLVVSMKLPNPDLLLLDKQLVYAEYNKIKPIICLNKIDLEEEETIDYIAKIYENIGYEVIKTDAKNAVGVDKLKEKLKNNITAFSGNSGVGKSTIINSLFGKNITEEGLVSQKNKRGKNTTTAVTLYELEKNTYIADTPGFSTFDINEIDYKNLDKEFIDFIPFIQDCRYVGCSHIYEQEKECSVKRAVLNGKLSKSRYDNFVKIYKELEENYKRRYN